MSSLIFNNSITTSIIDVDDAIDISTVKKDIAEYNKKMTKWITEVKLWQMHDRIVKKNIFNKLNEIFMKWILNVTDFKMMWNVLNQRYADQSFTKEYILYFQILFIILSICNDDLQKYLIKYKFINKNLTIMKMNLIERFLTSIMMFNLKRKFKNYVFRIIIELVLSSFEKINNDLFELNWISIRDIQIMTFRVNVNKINNNSNQENDNKSVEIEKNKFKSKIKNDWNLKIKCIECNKCDFNKNNCHNCNSNKKKKYKKKV